MYTIKQMPVSLSSECNKFSCCGWISNLQKSQSSIVATKTTTFKYRILFRILTGEVLDEQFLKLSLKAIPLCKQQEEKSK